MAASPDDADRSEEQNRRRDRRVSDDEEFRCDRTDHRRHECQGTVDGDRGHEQGNRGTDFDEAGQVAEPLTDADGVEQRHHGGRASSFEPPASRNMPASAIWTTQSAMTPERPRRTDSGGVKDSASDMINLLSS